MGFSLFSIKNFIFMRPNHTQTRSDELHPADPSLVLLPPYLTTKSIDTDRLPIVEYANFKSRNHEKEEEKQEEDDGEDEDSKCAVCLNRIEAWNDVRELGNCEHAFHVGCLDSWIDSGSDTCPVCRAPVVSDDVAKEEERDPWRSQRMMYLFGEDCLMEEL